MPRHVLLHCGIPIDRPALGVNRLCGSGFQAIVNGAQDILVGAAKISLTGGVENMSQSPFAVRGTRFGTSLGPKYEFEDMFWVSFLEFNYTRITINMICMRAQATIFRYNFAGRWIECSFIRLHFLS